jgi:hypothetical protein
LQRQMSEAASELHRSIEQILPPDCRPAILDWLAGLSRLTITAGSTAAKDVASRQPGQPVNWSA